MSIGPLQRDRPAWFVWGLWLCFAGDLAKHALLMLAGPLQPWPDSSGYWRLGSDAAHGDWWLVASGVAYRTPVYPWFLALFQWLCGRYSLLAVVLCQHVLELAASWLTSSTVGHITHSRRAALAAYAWCVCLTARSLFANTVLTESVAVFLLALLLWIISLPGFTRNWKLVAAAGVTLGLAVLERPAAAAFLPAVAWAATMFVAADAAWRHRVARLVLALGLALAVIMPWCLRNAIVWHRFSLSVFLGRELWTANFSPWPGAHFVVPETGPGLALRERLQGQPVDLQHNWSVASALARQGLNDVELDDLMKDVSIQAVRQHPRQAGLHFFARCLTFWYVKDWELDEALYPSQATWQEQASWSNAMNRHRLRRALQWTPERSFRIVWAWSAITWLGVLGLLSHPPWRQSGVVLGLILLGLTALTAAFEIPCYRYRCIVEPTMVIAAVSGAVVFRKHPEESD